MEALIVLIVFAVFAIAIYLVGLIIIIITHDHRKRKKIDYRYYWQSLFRKNTPAPKEEKYFG